MPTTLLLILALAGLGGLLAYGLYAMDRIVRTSRAHLAGAQGAGSTSSSSPARAGRPAATPDAPRSFGRRAVWIAVRSQDAGQVCEALGLRTVLPANWAAGLEAVASEGIFVAPPIDGFVLAVGRDLHGDGDYERLVPPLLTRLSSTFGEAAWFLTHDQAEHHGWALARAGTLVRAYAYAEEHGEMLWQGEVTAIERELECFVDDPRDSSADEVKWWPDEALVLQIAARWTVDPSRIAARSLANSHGWLGRL